MRACSYLTGKYGRMMCILAFGLMFMNFSGIKAVEMENENQPLATLAIDVEKNFINLSNVSQTTTQDLSPNTDYTISVASSAKTGDVLMPVMILRGDRKQGAAWDDLDRMGKEFTLKKGNQVVTLSSSEAARWAKAVEPVFDIYVKSASKKGLPARDYVNFLKEAVKK